MPDKQKVEAAAKAKADEDARKQAAEAKAKEEAAAKQKAEAAAKATPSAGGSPFTSDCGSDGVMVGIKARTGSLVDSVQAVCVKVNSNGDWVGGQFDGARAGGSGGSPVDLMCANGWAVTAVYGKSGTLVDSIGVRCGKLGVSGGTVKIVSGSASRGPAGGAGGSAFDRPCSGAQIAKGISGRAGTLIDQLSAVACHNPTPQTATGVAAPVLVSVESHDEGYVLLGRGFGTDATIVQVYEQLGRVPASSVFLVNDGRIAVSSHPSGRIMLTVLVGFQGSNPIPYTHPTVAVPGAAPIIELFRLTPPILLGDNILLPAGTVKVTATVTLTAPAPADMLVPLTSSHPINVPPSVRIPKDSRTGTVTFTPPKLNENSTTVTVTAGQEGASRKTATLSIVYAELQSFTVAPPSVTGGVKSFGTIILTAKAPADGFVVPLRNSNSAAVVDPSIKVPAGQATVTFEIPTREVNADVSGTITAGQGTYAQTRPITVRR